MLPNFNLHQLPGNQNWQAAAAPPHMTVSARRDDVIVALFKNDGVPNPAKTAAAGRPIFDDREIVEVRTPGSKDVKVFPAHALCPLKEVDPYTGEEYQITYAERFPRQYAAFKSRSTQLMSGTPLNVAPFLTEARRMELRALNIYTVEALAGVDGQELKNLGPGGRELKNRAEQYLADTAVHAHDTQVAAKMEALIAQNAAQQQDIAKLMAQLELRAAAEERAKLADYEGQHEQSAPGALNKPTPFDEMSTDQLREYIRSRTGFPVQGNLLNKNTLIRMARDADAAAARAQPPEL